MTDLDHLDDGPSAAGPTPATDGSPLSDIRQRFATWRSDDHVDLTVPGSNDPEIVVRYGKVAHEKIRRFTQKRKAESRGKGFDWEVLTNVDVLIEACVGVYCVLDGVTYAFDADDPTAEEWPRFDERVAKMIPAEFELKTAVDIVRALYGFGHPTAGDGAILSAADRVVTHSGYSGDAIVERLEGE
jgi:hypothetical protein